MLKRKQPDAMHLFEEVNRLAVKAYRIAGNEGFSHKHPMSIEEYIWRGFHLYEDAMRTRNVVNKDVINSKLKIRPPFPSSTTTRAKHVIRFLREDDPKRTILTFAQTYSAQAMVNAVINIAKKDDKSNKVKWVSDDHIHIAGIDITCPELEAIIEYEPNEAEAEWELPTPYDRYAERIALGHEATPEPTKKRVEPVSGEYTKPQRTPRPSKEGLVTIQQICAKIKMEPSEARALLRKSKTPKPDVGWAWDEKEATKIEKMLKGK